MPDLIPNNNIIDLELPESKKKFRFGKDDNRIVEIDTADFNFLNRLSEAYPKLVELQGKVRDVPNGVDLEHTDDNVESAISSIGALGNNIRKIDEEMRELIDYIFDAPVSQAAVPSGTMYDTFNGTFRFDLVISTILTQYEDRYKSEFAKMNKSVSKHTGKYMK